MQNVVSPPLLSIPITCVKPSVRGIAVTAYRSMRLRAVECVAALAFTNTSGATNAAPTVSNATAAPVIRLNLVASAANAMISARSPLPITLPIITPTALPAPIMTTDTILSSDCAILTEASTTSLPSSLSYTNR